MDAKVVNEIADRMNCEDPSEDLRADAVNALREYASLLASVEGSGEEVVRRLTMNAYDKKKYAMQEDGERAAARIVSDAQEKERLRAELASVKAERDGLVDTIISVSGYQDVNGAILSCALSVRAAHTKDAQ